MKLLLTAFDPFGGDPVNPALEAVKLVSGTVGAVQVVKLEVPTVFGRSIDTAFATVSMDLPKTLGTSSFTTWSAPTVPETSFTASKVGLTGSPPNGSNAVRKSLIVIHPF